MRRLLGETVWIPWVCSILMCAASASGADTTGSEDKPAFQIVETMDGPIADDPESEDCYVYVVVSTTKGDIILELHRCAAPETVDNFLRYVDGGFYDDTLFHRVVNGFVIQGGGYDLNEEEKETLGPIPLEWPNGLKNHRGTIAMARGDEPNSATSQFFINIKNSGSLDRPTRGGAGYLVFGRVVEGMDTVDQISVVQTIRKPNMGDVQGPMDPIQIIVTGRVPEKEAAELAKKHGESRLAMAGPALRERFEKRWKIEQREKNKLMTEEERFEQALAYIKKAGWDITKGVKLPSGVWYIDDEIGVGDSPGPDDYVAMKWDGWLSWGEKFGSWEDTKDILRGEVSGFVPGYREALRTMKPGGERVFIIPSHLAYGEFGREPKIPVNSALIYKVQLLGVLPATEEVPVPDAKGDKKN